MLPIELGVSLVSTLDLEECANLHIICKNCALGSAWRKAWALMPSDSRIGTGCRCYNCSREQRRSLAGGRRFFNAEKEEKLE